MNSPSFPDVNVWLALVAGEHVHHDAAVRWWNTNESEQIAFCRPTQLGLLRLLTTASVMNQKPLTSAAAWTVYDRLFADHRVGFLPEPPELEIVFRSMASSNAASPKVWADAYLAAFAHELDGVVVTFDKGLAARATSALLLA
jgi:hypothetical protein